MKQIPKMNFNAILCLGAIISMTYNLIKGNTDLIIYNGIMMLAIILLSDGLTK